MDLLVWIVHWTWVADPPPTKAANTRKLCYVACVRANTYGVCVCDWEYQRQGQRGSKDPNLCKQFSFSGTRFLKFSSERLFRPLACEADHTCPAPLLLVYMREDCATGVTSSLVRALDH